jgi:hypothetical protein
MPSSSTSSSEGMGACLIREDAGRRITGLELHCGYGRTANEGWVHEMDVEGVRALSIELKEKSEELVLVERELKREYVERRLVVDMVETADSGSGDAGLMIFDNEEGRTTRTVGRMIVGT